MQFKSNRLTSYFFRYTLGAVLATLVAVGSFWISEQYNVGITWFFRRKKMNQSINATPNLQILQLYCPGLT